jgi:hypothetical protein
MKIEQKSLRIGRKKNFKRALSFFKNDKDKVVQKFT